jgi:hypothetical protein
MARRRRDGIDRLSKLNLFLAFVGLASVVAAFWTQLWVAAVIIAMSYLSVLIVLAVIEHHLTWPAWRIVIVLVLIGIVLGARSLPPRTWTATVDTQGSWSWQVTADQALNYFPVTDKPASGREMDALIQDIEEFTVRCWEPGKLTTENGDITNAEVDWVQVVDGRLDGYWIPFAAVNTDSPGIARKLPKCSSWNVRWWPF